MDHHHHRLFAALTGRPFTSIAEHQEAHRKAEQEKVIQDARTKASFKEIPTDGSAHRTLIEAFQRPWNDEPVAAAAPAGVYQRLRKAVSK